MVSRPRDETKDGEILAPHGVDLQPVGMALTRPVGTVLALGDHALEPVLAGGIVEGEPVAGDRLSKLQRSRIRPPVGVADDQLAIDDGLRRCQPPERLYLRVSTGEIR